MPSPDPKDAAIRDLQGNLVRATAQIEDLSERMTTIVQQRSRIRPVLPEGSADQVQQTSEASKDPKTVKRMRKVNMSIRKEDMIGSGDANVRALGHATERVDKIEDQDGDDKAMEAAE